MDQVHISQQVSLARFAAGWLVTRSVRRLQQKEANFTYCTTFACQKGLNREINIPNCHVSNHCSKF